MREHLLAFSFNGNVESQNLHGGPAAPFVNAKSAPIARRHYKEEFLLKSFETAERGLFDLRVNNWIAETETLSSPSSIKRSRYFAELVDMGDVVVKFALEKLANRDVRLHWFLLLRQIANQDPVPPYSRGRIFEMADAWLSWGREKAII